MCGAAVSGIYVDAGDPYIWDDISVGHLDNKTQPIVAYLRCPGLTDCGICGEWRVGESFLKIRSVANRVEKIA